MKLRDSVTVMRPESCSDCPFGGADGEGYEKCCTESRDSWAYRDTKGKRHFKIVESPEDAVRHGCFCMFKAEGGTA